MGRLVAAALVALLALATTRWHILAAEAPAARGSSRFTTSRHSREAAPLRGGAWTHHEAHDAPPCGFFTARRACRFVALMHDEQLLDRWGQRHVVKRASAVEDRVFDPFADQLTPVPTSSVVFSLSRNELYQLDTVDVDFTVHGFTPGQDDWIGVYCHEQEDPSKTPDAEYIDWQWVNASAPIAGEAPHSTRRLSFGPMVNMRCAWQFKYFARLSDDATAFARLGESHLLRLALGDGEPLHVRLSVTTSPSEMHVMWVSGAVADPHVQFGDDPTRLTRRANATRDTYAASDMCQAPATTVSAQHFRDPGMIYSAVMTDLHHDRDYYYRVGDRNRVLSRVFRFRVPPPPGHHPAGTVMSFFMYADLGEWTSASTGLSPPLRSGATMQLVAKELATSGKRYVAAFHNGDISYARGMAFQWEQFAALVEPVAARIPYMVAVGNHEYDYTAGGVGKDPSGAGATSGFHPREGNYGFDSVGECGVPTNKRFTMPNNGNQVFWYSTEMGLTHHTVISSEHDFTRGAPMRAWLEQDLARVDRTRTPWLFLHLHRPLYCSEEYAADNRVADLLRRHLEPVLEAYRIDVVFAGHFHAFERTCPVLNQQCRTARTVPDGSGPEEARAPVHIMVGSAGASLDRTTHANVSWSEAHQQEYGYGRVHVHNASHALFEFQRNRDGAIADRAWIVSRHDW